MGSENLTWLGETKTYKKCPFCSSGELSSRIRRPTYLKLLFWIEIKGYRCDGCMRKVYLRKRRKKN